MSDFWTNISRYPRFFISSVAGLILVILAPFKNLLQIKKFKYIFLVLFISFILLLYKVLASMTGI
jgi:hypothetical protein